MLCIDDASARACIPHPHREQLQRNTHTDTLRHPPYAHCSYLPQSRSAPVPAAFRGASTNKVFRSLHMTSTKSDDAGCAQRRSLRLSVRQEQELLQHHAGVALQHGSMAAWHGRSRRSHLRYDVHSCHSSTPSSLRTSRDTALSCSGTGRHDGRSGGECARPRCRFAGRF